jgi:hypothetical protein
VKALVSVTFLIEVNNRHEAEEIRDAMDIGCLTGAQKACDEHGIDYRDHRDLIVMFPASLTVEPETSNA